MPHASLVIPLDPRATPREVKASLRWIRAMSRLMKTPSPLPAGALPFRWWTCGWARAATGMRDQERRRRYYRTRSLMSVHLN